MNIKLLESSLLFILLFEIFKSQSIFNIPVMVVSAFLILMFMSLSFFGDFFWNGKYLAQLRFGAIILLVISVHGFLLVRSVGERARDASYAIHDGAIITEQSYLALLRGENPYSLSFNTYYQNQPNYGDKLAHNETDKNMYSPLAFVINLPVFAISQSFLGFIDMRIGSVLFLILTLIVSLRIVSEKLLFMILFMFNPVFVDSLYFGGNDVFVLFFLALCLVLLSFKKFYLSTFALALGCATKLLILPLAPLYFLFLLNLRGFNISMIIRQAILFVLVNLSIYLPFIFWNLNDFIDDFVIYNFFGGSQGRPIAGFLGFGQVLSQLGVIPRETNIPFFIMLIPVSILALVIADKIFKKSNQISTLLFSYIIYFIAVFSFSRIVQSDYLAYLSQVILLGAMAKPEI